MKRAYERLISIHLVEENDEALDEIDRFTWRWTYPTIDGPTRAFIEKRLFSIASQTISSHDNRLENFFFYNISSTWIYIFQSPTFVTKKFAFILLTSDFYPYTYKELLAVFTQLYQKQTALKLFLHYYLTLIIENRIVVHELNDLKYSLEVNKKDDITLNTQGCQIKSIIKLFHLDVILIYTALLLKRKIAVYHHNPFTLFDFMLALPAFVSHRIDCKHKFLVPNVDLHSTEQLSDLKARTHYVATFNNSRVEEEEDLYDIYINLAAVEITIAHNSREVFSMTKTHKDVAISLVRVTENETSTDKDVINEICKKTSELRNALFSMANEDTSNPLSESSLEEKEKVNENPKQISKSMLRNKLLSPNLEMFYWNFALAEGLAATTSD